MRIPDRYWPLLVLAAVVCGAVAIVAPWMFLATILPSAQEFGDPITGDVLQVGGLTLLTLYSSIKFALGAVRARDRFSRRKAALRGEKDAIPLSSISPGKMNAPDIAVEPLMLAWRATKRMRYFVGPLILLVVLIVLLLIMGTIALIVWFATLNLPDFSQFGWLDPLLFAVGIGYSILAIVLFVLVLRRTPTFFGRPYGVTATADGIQGRSESGRRFFLRWDEMRLFEVEERIYSTSRLRHFRVYGRRDIAEWRDAPSNNGVYAPEGMTPVEMAFRLAAMVDVVHARTGLVPRTFSKALLVEKPSEKPVRRGRTARLATTLTIMVLALVTVGFGAATLALPLTTSDTLNALIALSLAATCAVLVVFPLAATVRLIRDRRLFPRDGNYPGTYHPLAAPPDAPDAIYALAFGQTWPARIANGAFGLVLTVNALPFLLILTTNLAIILPLPMLPTTPTGMNTVLVVVLGFYGVFGVALVGAALRRRPATFRTDAAGISMIRGVIPVVLTWRDVAAIVARVRRGKIDSFAVKDSAGKRVFAWPARSTALRIILPAKGAQPITPEELAALVAKRSGHEIETEDEP